MFFVVTIWSYSVIFFERFFVKDVFKEYSPLNDETGYCLLY